MKKIVARLHVANESEKYLERRLAQLVKEKGGKALKFASSTDIGYPDRLVLMPGGQSYWVELKSTGERPRKLQTIRHEELRKLGFRVFVIDTEDKLNIFINERI